MKIEDFFNQQNVIELSFFNFENAITAAYFARENLEIVRVNDNFRNCLLYTSPSPRDGLLSRMPSSA